MGCLLLIVRRVRVRGIVLGEEGAREEVGMMGIGSVDVERTCVRKVL